MVSLKKNMDNKKLLALILLVSCTTTPYEEPPVEPSDWEKCEPFLTHDGEAWTTCMAMT